MIKPVTSTIVATNGADDVAGSAPKRLNIKGNIEPIKDPHNTIPTKDKLTVAGFLTNAHHTHPKKMPSIDTSKSNYTKNKPQ